MSSAKRFASISTFLIGTAIVGGVFLWILSSDPESGNVATSASEIKSDLAAVSSKNQTQEAASAATEPTLFFAYATDKLSRDGKAALDNWATQLHQDPTMNLLIEGHCDERGSKAYNKRLGELRALATKNYLTSKGIDAKRLKIVSRGESRPAAKGRNERAWAKNRRAELTPLNVTLSQSN